MIKYAVVYVTVPGEKVALDISKTLVENKLAACVNIVPQIRSIYSWKGEICDDSEMLLIIKTKPSAFEALKSTVLKIHPYDVPEIILLPIENGHKEYLQWFDENVTA